MEKTYAIIDTLYLLPTMIFLKKLNDLNVILLALESTSPLVILRYENYKPLKYFVFACILAVVGAYLCIYFFRQILCTYLGNVGVLVAVFSIIVDALSIICIIISINNPILRSIIAIMATLIVGIDFAKYQNIR